jgi:hypothetical protein
VSDWLTLPDRLLTEAHTREHTTVGDLLTEAHDRICELEVQLFRLRSEVVQLRDETDQ